MLDLNNNWNKVAPITLQYTSTARDMDLVSGRIKQFYFPTGNISLSSLTKLYSDRYFFQCTSKSASFWAQQGAAVYPYIFSYQGNFTILNAMGINDYYGEFFGLTTRIPHQGLFAE